MGLFSKTADTAGETHRVNGNEPERGTNRHVASRKLKGLTALVASAVRLDRKAKEGLSRLTQTWQDAALMYYDLLGPVHFAAGFYARGLSGLRLYVGELDDDGEVKPSDNADARAILARVRDGMGSRESLIETFGRLWFVTGEAYLLWTNVEGVESWEIVSPDELRITDDDTYVRVSAPNLKDDEYKATDEAEPEPGEAIAYRLWNPHPRHSKLADSPMRAVIEDCQEMVLLGQAVQARLKSRLAGNGILTWPNELSEGGDELDAEDVPGDEDAKADPTVEDFIESAVAPLENHGSASAVVPFILRGPAQWLHPDYVRWIQTRNPEEDYKEAGLRDEVLKRLAIAMDMPIEALLGMTDANHWSAWQVDETIWKSHLRPVAQALAGNLTSAYLRPTLIDKAGMTPEDAARFVIAYDEAAIVTNPDRSKDAQEAFDRFAIGKKALRDAKGFTDDDAPDEAELAVMYEEANVGQSAPTDGAPPADTTAPQSEPQQDGTEGDPGLNAAASLAVRRARELAGRRVLGFLQGKELGRTFDGIAPGFVCASFGKEALEELGAPPAQELIAGACRDDLIAVAVEWGLTYDSASAFADRTEARAALTLYDETP